MKKILVLLIAVVFGTTFFCVAADARDRAKVTIKIATLAPRSTKNMMWGFRDTVRKETNNEVDFKIYWGGVQGDEIDVLRKIRLKQLHGGEFVGTGLSRIVPAVRVTEVPFLFRNSDEVSYVRSRLESIMDKLFEEQGFVVIGWHDIGFVYNFSKEPITSFDVLRRQKCWVWGDDALSVAVYKALGIIPVSLSFTDVMTSLSTKLIDNANITPFGAVAFRWYTRFKYMSGFPTLNGVGGFVITKEMWDKISPESQHKIKKIAKPYFRRLTENTIKADDKAIEVLKKAGITIVNLEDTKISLEDLEDVGRKAREALVGKLYSRELMEHTLSLLDEYRKSHPNSSYKRIEEGD